MTATAIQDEFPQDIHLFPQDIRPGRRLDGLSQPFMQKLLPKSRVERNLTILPTMTLGMNPFHGNLVL
jgi:hypothetical protein